jgi:hypothetical protein
MATQWGYVLASAGMGAVLASSAFVLYQKDHYLTSLRDSAIPPASVPLDQLREQLEDQQQRWALEQEMARLQQSQFLERSAREERRNGGPGH